MKTNKRAERVVNYTHEGAEATPVPNAGAALRRAIMSCMLFEDQFYESGVEISARIAQLVNQVPPEVAAYFAVKAREDMKLRHAPLLVVREMARSTPAHRRLVASTLANVIRRPDELTEFLALYWKEKKQPLSAQVKKGLARAFAKFNEYSLAKYDRDEAVKLRDVLFLSHAKPNDVPKDRVYTKDERKRGKRPTTAGEKLYQRVVERTLTTPDTWEVALSALGSATPEEKQAEWTRLLTEERLGALALLRNLRNMQEAKVDHDHIRVALEKVDVTMVLPHRFIAAARYAPIFEPLLEQKMFETTKLLPKLKGLTVFLVDVSGSMDTALSAKSDLRRLDAACGVAMVGREMCEQAAVVTFSNQAVMVPPRRGFALRDAIVQSQVHGSTYLGKAVEVVNKEVSKYDRIVVITDEQSADHVPPPINGRKGYMINVASYKHGVGYGQWNKIDGFSEAVMRYIAEFEQGEQV